MLFPSHACFVSKFSLHSAFLKICFFKRSFEGGDNKNPKRALLMKKNASSLHPGQSFHMRGPHSTYSRPITMISSIMTKIFSGSHPGEQLVSRRFISNGSSSRHEWRLERYKQLEFKFSGGDQSQSEVAGALLGEHRQTPRLSTLDGQPVSCGHSALACTL